MQLKSRRIISTIGISTATVGCALTLAVTGAFGRSSPMRSHSIAATHTFLGTRGLNRLSRDSNLPSDVSEAVEQLATFDNSSPSAAVARVQLARQGTSEESTVYTFTDDRSIAYAEFPASSQNATVTVTYADGSSNTIPTNLVAPTTG